MKLQGVIGDMSANKDGHSAIRIRVGKEEVIVSLPKEMMRSALGEMFSDDLVTLTLEVQRQ